MISVFLAEDEAVIRNGIRNNIAWEKEGFRFAGEAGDGELAYPLIKKEKPDILITDIKMPFMDGLELCRVVKKELPQIKIIILSGYNDFSYAKEAINIGVTDYLLKPVPAAKLLETVKRVADMIEKEQEQERLLMQYQRESEEAVRLEKHQIWNDLASNQVTTAELLEQGQRLGMEFAAGAYRVLLFKLMQEGSSVGCSQESIEASEKIEQLSSAWPEVLTFDRSPEGWVFLIKGSSEEEVLERQKKCCRELVDLVSAYDRLDYFGGIGLTVYRLGNIRDSYQCASRAFSSRFFTESNQILDGEHLPDFQQKRGEKIDVQGMPSKKTQRELVERFLRSGTAEDIESFLEEYLVEIGETHLRSMLFRQYVVMDFFFVVMDFLETLSITSEKLPEDIRDLDQIVARASSVTKVKEELHRLLRTVMELRDRHSRKKYSELLEEARAFIAENYQKEEMSLNTVAARVNISPSYFSTIFSGETGQTFVEYLTQVRLEKAKELLMCTKLRSAEIAYQVGYKDSHYFSYIFKKVIGCSPKEYRNRGSYGAE